MRVFILVPLDGSNPFNMGPTNTLGQIKPMRTLGTSREVQATNMADIPSVELIEFGRPYSNEVNLYGAPSSRVSSSLAQRASFISLLMSVIRQSRASGPRSVLRMLG